MHMSIHLQQHINTNTHFHTHVHTHMDVHTYTAHMGVHRYTQGSTYIQCTPEGREPKAPATIRVSELTPTVFKSNRKR